MAEHAAKGSSGEVRPEGTAPAAHTPAVGTPAVGIPRGQPAAGNQRSPAVGGGSRAAITAAGIGHRPGGSTRPRAGGPGGPARTAQSKRWELIIAISIALVTVTGAVLTYLSIQQESAAVEADRQSVVETLQVQNQVVAAATQARAYGVLAGRYRQLMAEASVLAATDPDQAAMLRADATGVNLNGVTDYTTGTGAAAQYNFAAALQGALTVLQSSTIPPDQPARTAALAEHHRQVAGRVALCVVGLLCVVVLLTLARVVPAERFKRGLVGVAAAGYLAATIAGIVRLA